jgi:hypothetical protein
VAWQSIIDAKPDPIIFSEGRPDSLQKAALACTIENGLYDMATSLAK